MEVVVDGKTGMNAPETGTTFQVIFEGLRKTVASRRRAIVSFILDGEVLSVERQADLAGQPPGTYGLLEVRTVDPFEFSVGTLTGLLSHLKNMERTHDEAAACVSSGEFSKALEKFDACFQGWDILIRAVRDVAGLSSADIRSLKAGASTVQDRIRALQDTLLRFSAAFEFKDVMRIAEIVQNELKPHLAEWKAVVEALSQHVARLSGAARA
jgi:hypothetical protein